MNFKTKQTFRIFWAHAKRYPGAIFLLLVSMAAAISAETFSPYLYRDLFNLLAADASLQQLSLVVLKILGISATGWFFWRIATFTNTYFQPSVMRDLLNTCFNYLHEHSYSFFSNNFAGSIVKKIGRYERAFEDIADQIYWSLLPTAL